MLYMQTDEAIQRIKLAISELQRSSSGKNSPCGGMHETAIRVLEEVLDALEKRELEYTVIVSADSTVVPLPKEYR